MSVADMATNLEDAIAEAIAAHGVDAEAVPEGWVATDWVLVGAAVGPKAFEVAYFSLSPSMPHTALGLLEVSVGRWKDAVVYGTEDEDEQEMP